jgi:alpha-D-xyloside xylohydrolase
MNYAKLTGKPGLPPSWTYGLYLSTSFTTSYDEKTVTGFLEGMKERSCPVRVLHLDCGWMKSYDWCSFEFDRDSFRNPENYLRTVKEKYNINVCVWINSYISQRASIFQEGVDNGYFIKRTNGDVWQWDLWQAGMAVVDFTNPDACKWYAKQLHGLIDIGVDTFKTDFGERIPHLGVTYFDGSDPRKAHNFYPHLYNKVVFDVLKERFGEHKAALFARSATAGGQRFPVHWGGDCESTYEAMAESLRGGLSLTSTGFAFWSHDIGGFEGKPPAGLFKRWLAFGLFSSHSRLHGSNSYRVPWLYDTDGDDEASRVCSIMTKTKLRLMPYLYAQVSRLEDCVNCTDLPQSIYASNTGIPVMRSMVIEFPDDPMTQYLDKQ